MITVWGRASSSNVQALMWGIGELDLAYTRVDAGFTYGVVDTSEYEEMNPNKTVPTIRDGDGAPIWETGAVLRYLSRKYGDEQFWPRELEDCVVIDKWAEWSKINVALNFTGPVFWQAVRVPEEKRNAALLNSAIEKLEIYLTIADQRLSDCEYLGGDYFTLADIQFGHVLYRYFDIEIDRKKLNNLRRYYDLLIKRDPYQQHVMISYAELKDTM